MARRTRLMLSAAGLAVMAFILGATILQAVRQRSVEPLWMIAWMPGVLVAVFYRPARGRPCWPRLQRRSQP